MHNINELKMILELLSTINLTILMMDHVFYVGSLTVNSVFGGESH